MYLYLLALYPQVSKIIAKARKQYMLLKNGTRGESPPEMSDKEGEWI